MKSKNKGAHQIVKNKVCTLPKVEQISFFRLKSRASLARYPTWRKATTKTVTFDSVRKSHLFSLWEFSSSRKLFPFIIQRSIYPLRTRSLIHELTSTHSNCINTGIITGILKKYSIRLNTVLIKFIVKYRSKSEASGDQSNRRPPVVVVRPSSKILFPLRFSFRLD
jgi:hypothetical protein